MLPVLIFVLFCFSRALIRALPGDPLDTLMAESGTNLPRELLQKELGLDQPFLLALKTDLTQALEGDFGKSIFNQQPIWPDLKLRLLKTFQLVFVALLIGLPLSLTLGIKAAAASVTQHGFLERMPDYFCTFLGSLTAAAPIPWIGPLLIYIFSVKLELFTIGGELLLPALALAVVFSGFWSRLIRERVRESLRLGAATGARARGIPEWRVLIKYGLAPVSGSLIAYLGTQIGALMSGAFVTEIIFDWPGMGTLLVESILKRDYPVVEGALFFSASACCLGTLLGDLGQEMLLRRKGPEGVP